jgi:putative RecB family exonuclease
MRERPARIGASLAERAQASRLQPSREGLTVGEESSRAAASGTKSGDSINQESSAEEQPRSGLEPRPTASLSPSRAADFMNCPLLYRFRTIDKLPERPSEAATRGTLVHSVLEQLFDEPAGDRTTQVAISRLPTAWQELQADDLELAALLFGPEDNWDRHRAGESLGPPDDKKIADFMKAAEKLLHTYFRLEDPRVLEPDQREVAVSTTLDSGLTLRGIIDRIDKAPTGEIRVVDYKTGRSPSQGWESKALFQMRFYGLVLWRISGQMPSRLQLMYLGNQEILSEDPTERQLLTTQAKLEALWVVVEQARNSGDWKPRASKLCGWCSFKSLCPEWGGTTPPLPD